MIQLIYSDGQTIQLPEATQEDYEELAAALLNYSGGRDSYWVSGRATVTVSLEGLRIASWE